MTQRVFDIENEKDMADLWDILPDNIYKIEFSCGEVVLVYDNAFRFSIDDIFSINWHDKTEIKRPIQEATEADIGKLCYFWEGKDYAIGELKEIGDDTTLDIYCMEDSKDGVWFAHCRRLTNKDIKELC